MNSLYFHFFLLELSFLELSMVHTKERNFLRAVDWSHKEISLLSGVVVETPLNLLIGRVQFQSRTNILT